MAQNDKSQPRKRVHDFAPTLLRDFRIYRSMLPVSSLCPLPQPGRLSRSAESSPRMIVLCVMNPMVRTAGIVRLMLDSAVPSELAGQGVKAKKPHKPDYPEKYFCDFRLWINL